MADSHRFSTDNTTVDSQGIKTFVSSPEKQSKESKREFSEDEEALVRRMYNLLGGRWALIAGRIPGRTEEEIEKYWNTRDSASK